MCARSLSGELLKLFIHPLAAATGEALGITEFDPAACMAPLPRAYQWADGSACVNHVELVRKARGAEMPPSFWTDPLMYQGGSGPFLCPRELIRMAASCICR